MGKKFISNDDLKQRVLDVRKVLPRYWWQMYQEMFPQDSSETDKTQVKNVVNLRKHDLNITKRLERLAKKVGK